MYKHKMFHVKHFASHISLTTSPRDTASQDDAFNRMIIKKTAFDAVLKVLIQKQF